MTYSIGALSRRTAVSPETIRYYERIGVLPKPPRTEGGHRAYDRTFEKRLDFVSRGRKLGFSLAEIRSLLVLIDENEYTCADVKQLTLRHAGQIRRKISDLKNLERTLNDMAAKCHGNHVPDCPIVDALFD